MRSERGFGVWVARGEVQKEQQHTRAYPQRKRRWADGRGERHAPESRDGPRTRASASTARPSRPEMYRHIVPLARESTVRTYRQPQNAPTNHAFAEG
eukprot:1172798-Rhodomonas_salina.3